MTQNKNEKIKPSEILYIKLGDSGIWENECIFEENSIKLSYHNVSHKDCMKNNWNAIREDFEKYNDNTGAITRHINQIKNFYQKDRTVMWITFHQNTLWWCFTDPEIYYEELTGYKTRKVIGNWKCDTINGVKLTKDRLIGSLANITNFRGTICSVKDTDYLIRKINNEQEPLLVETENILQSLKVNVGKLIQRLTPDDFEILVDLIFRQAGWQRIDIIGRYQKTIDLDLTIPILNQRIGVQIKSSSNLKEFEYYSNEFKEMEEFSEFYYIVHSPSTDLQQYAFDKDGIKLMFIDDLSRNVVQYGLVEWIINKS